MQGGATRDKGLHMP